MELELNCSALQSVYGKAIKATYQKSLATRRLKIPNRILPLGDVAAASSVDITAKMTSYCQLLASELSERCRDIAPQNETVKDEMRSAK